MPKNKDCNNIIITLEGIEKLEKYRLRQKTVWTIMPACEQPKFPLRTQNVPQYPTKW